MVINFIVSKLFVETPDCCTPLSNTRVKENNSSLDKPWSNFNLAPADKSGLLVFSKIPVFKLSFFARFHFISYISKQGMQLSD